MTGDFKVEDIKICACDRTQREILEIYAFKQPRYAVYRTATRVMVQFSDDETEEAGQRTAFAKLNPLRSDIGGLIDGWRQVETCQPCAESGEKRPQKEYVQPPCLLKLPSGLENCLWKRRRDRLGAKARRYDRNVADALVSALENDFDGAAAQLQATKDDIIAERTSRARFEYLLTAFNTCLALALVCWVGWTVLLWVGPEDTYDFVAFLLLAAAVGAAGAFFSVAIAIRARTVLTDLRQRDNRADAMLRIAIGAIGAAFLIAALREKVAVLTFGTLSTTMISDTASPDWLAVVVAAFVAGFSERLVPDLLEKAATKTDDTATAPKKPPGPGPAPTPGPPPAAKPPDHDDDKDCCSVQNFVPPGQETPDSELPPARGGVAKN